MTGTDKSLLNLSIFLLRCTIGVILFAVGAGKVFGWFGGMGFEPTVQAYLTGSGFSAPLAYLSIFTELLGGLFFIIGFLTRPAAIAITINMCVAFLVMLPSGFLAVAAYPFSLMMSSFIILLSGPLTYSLDNIIFKQHSHE
jgi:putative oxidoreductase